MDLLLQILEITPWFSYCLGNNSYLEIFQGVHFKLNHISSDVTYCNLLVTEYPCVPINFPALLHLGGYM